MFISKNLLVFMTTAQEGSLTNAAIKLFSTLPPMSRSIKILEDSLGFKLFTRTTSGLKLTDRGAAFYKDIYPNYARLIELGTTYRKNKSGTINIGTHQLKSDYAGFLCDYFLDSGNCNIEFKENINDTNQSDVIISTKEIKGCSFDVELTANCQAVLLYASHLNALSNKSEYLKQLPLLQSGIFSTSCCFQKFLCLLKEQGYSGNILNIDDPRIRHNLIEKGAGISLTTEWPNNRNPLCDTETISCKNDVKFDIHYYIYFKSSMINKDLFIKYIQKNSSLSWREVKTRN
ncbi:TPA: LysR family transcriptional regulator [Yersinia enterocolitica]|uniref:LysR family transcriptional regulator n=1 Tax=Yersinia enterocolitica TaxID=630 RepID=UPI0005DB0FED|nr:LysR family transcriptional regulator [Yersinia enterocolitica]EKN4906534.1 LysR family transcriptional regulator [Yersinia enterocolitica]MDA5529364.1 LysR family transcriptional regulator [Yersinia enterocolitica]CQJ28475.1 LysR family transcriptional regulator [Yersinia enterocolitica]CQR11503.1 LysR family transcriptional regulator [Yersinia enterocolitica]HDL7689241.1 LysR family transcriptional regulator [Yersinia enterocolitica]